MTTTDVSGKSVRWASVDTFVASLGKDPSLLPFSAVIILEAMLVGAELGLVPHDWAVNFLMDTDRSADILFPVSRVLLQDAAGLPLLVDLAALREAAVSHGRNPSEVQPSVPVDLVIDHSVQTQSYGSASSLGDNLRAEFSENDERYRFVKWAQRSFDNLSVVQPGNGIVHQIHMEHIAPVVTERQGWRICDTVVGTDSHTTMINGLGVVGWGVGGIEAEQLLLGEPLDLVRPEFVKVELTGCPQPGVMAADIALTLTAFLRKAGIVGSYLEFVGEGVDNISVPDRCTLANMAPEYGATLAFFPCDKAVIDYLLDTGRSEDHLKAIREHLENQRIFGWSSRPNAVYDRTFQFNLSEVTLRVAGPSRPDQLVDVSNLVGLRDTVKSPWYHRVALAAITSCTNTANPASMIAAGLVARKARALGLSVHPSIKTVLAPGSRRIVGYLETSGLQNDLSALGFHIAAFGCGVCVGNTGELAAGVEEAITADGGAAVAVLSGNRNFEGRIHPALPSAYLMSPALVIAFALAGRIDLNITSDVIGNANGRNVVLSDLWPTAVEISETLDQCKPTSSTIIETQAWRVLPAQNGQCFRWGEASTYFIKPPFFEQGANDGLPPIMSARPLLALGDAITTDHISPVGPIEKTSDAARFLVDAGVPPERFNTYASRRGNHHIMMRGTFANKRIRNFLTPDVAGPITRHLPTGDLVSIFEAARRYIEADIPTIIFAGERYGSGSARDWAAKGTALLGVRAVIARSFERIHRSNLVMMGVLPIQFENPSDYADAFISLLLNSTDVAVSLEQLETDAICRPHCVIRIECDGSSLKLPAIIRADTARELELLRQGGFFAKVVRKLAV
ncbi:aconitate hydratase [Agrobacterium larrymoorei]|uniref:aconitate hydratase n=1 Tax=Agrobacterium larrymoorei TaxID=160699 RepID=A0AAF0KH59_9HYPH|nr:aconitate hydratase AcnA [Agrobacterium larrymoorei]WHA44112.1 aconitate hydratase AcnA [Agrobacterium larrymoorei]